MKRFFLIGIFALGLSFLPSTGKGDPKFSPVLQDTWANWNRRLEQAFHDFYPRKLPGRSMGIIVPNSQRHDLLPMATYGYEVLSPPKYGTVIVLLPAPEDYPLNGIVMPGLDILATSFGEFTVDGYLRSEFQNVEFPIFIDSSPFEPLLPINLQTQLAALKYFLKGKYSNLKILPIMVKFSDSNAHVKDLGPFLAETIKNVGLEHLVSMVIVGNLTKSENGSKGLILTDNNWMNSIRNLDVDNLLSIQEDGEMEDSGYTTPDFDSIALGTLTMQWLGADHAEVLAYAHSGQMVLTRDKSTPESYLVAGFASEPPYKPRIPHIERKKMVDVFDELFRSDILTMLRQTCLSIVDPTAAKPPALIQKNAGKKWPVYVSIYNASGEILGEAGSHVGVVPLEESLRKYAFEAINESKKKIHKNNMQGLTIEVSVPYGFSKLGIPEELIPLLNGIVVQHSRKSQGVHPNSWRTYPNPHQLLGAICYKLGLKPWAYATRKAKVESFRVLAFNEKEPFQDLRAPKKKKKKRDEFDDEDGGGAGDDGGFTF